MAWTRTSGLLHAKGVDSYQPSGNALGYGSYEAGRWPLIDGFALKDREGNVARVSKVARDITEKVRTQRPRGWRHTGAVFLTILFKTQQL